MTKKKHNVTGMTAEAAGYVWADDYSPAYEPNHKNLHSSHKVPKFKRRFASD